MTDEELKQEAEQILFLNGFKEYVNGFKLKNTIILKYRVGNGIIIGFIAYKPKDLDELEILDRMWEIRASNNKLYRTLKEKNYFNEFMYSFLNLKGFNELASMMVGD